METWQKVGVWTVIGGVGTWLVYKHLKDNGTLYAWFPSIDMFKPEAIAAPAGGGAGGGAAAGSGGAGAGGGSGTGAPAGSGGGAGTGAPAGNTAPAGIPDAALTARMAALGVTPAAIAQFITLEPAATSVVRFYALAALGDLEAIAAMNQAGIKFNADQWNYYRLRGGAPDNVDPSKVAADRTTPLTAAEFRTGVAQLLNLAGIGAYVGETKWV